MSILYRGIHHDECRCETCSPSRILLLGGKSVPRSKPYSKPADEARVDALAAAAHMPLIEEQSAQLERLVSEELDRALLRDLKKSGYDFSHARDKAFGTGSELDEYTDPRITENGTLPCKVTNLFGTTTVEHVAYDSKANESVPQDQEMPTDGYILEEEEEDPETYDDVSYFDDLLTDEDDDHYSTDAWVEANAKTMRQVVVEEVADTRPSVEDLVIQHITEWEFHRSASSELFAW